LLLNTLMQKARLQNNLYLFIVHSGVRCGTQRVAFCVGQLHGLHRTHQSTNNASENTID